MITETVSSAGSTPGTGTEPAEGPPRTAFLVRVVAIHVISYLIAGAVFSTLLDYRHVFEQPIIGDYMLAFGSTSLVLSTSLQVVRGLVLGVALLPLRSLLAGTRRGWLTLWLLLVGIGIVSTPAAAPSSLEGVLYSQLPLWYHLLGLPEILVQTLVFSWLLHRYLRHSHGREQAVPARVAPLLRAVVVSCLAFIGYAVVSVAFALASGAEIASTENLGLRTQALFLVLFVINVVVVLVVRRAAVDVGPPRHRLYLGAAVLLTNAPAIAAYQAVVLGDVGVAYPVLAPLLPAAIAALMTDRSRRQPS